MEPKKNFKNTLFIDIETVSGESNFSLLSDRMKHFWLKKAKNVSNPQNLALEELYVDRAALFAEFGKIIVIGMGFLYQNKEKELCLKVKTIANKDEKSLLLEFIQFINDTYKSRELTLVAHNGKEFDFPYLCRRMLVNGLEIPRPLQLQGKKPWEVLHQDTMELWKFGDRKVYISLDLLAELLGIPGSKTNLTGDKVHGVYYLEKDLSKIAAYCVEDVVTLAQLYLRYHFLQMVEEKNIDRITSI
ncbi:3'-5' exonuclease [Aquirufa sp. OSTEICH-129A]